MPQSIAWILPALLISGIPSQIVRVASGTVGTLADLFTNLQSGIRSPQTSYTDTTHVAESAGFYKVTLSWLHSLFVEFQLNETLRLRKSSVWIAQYISVILTRLDYCYIR
ncbi:hypothetical protein PDESU_02611 [Pontiella desulfatans]|uniref:Uncharacterized protein n=1 Tax=Pontiella desulfatans TaxID=2750659 RepID=A0A6C2U340_PONDE|nr:hypothetical protein [Pontiella desulfatans]VGO14054.1 hypothetical protein PDESU_02611 [Pontiella desulfatans]